MKKKLVIQEDLFGYPNVKKVVERGKINSRKWSRFEWEFFLLRKFFVEQIKREKGISNENSINYCI